MSTRVHSLFRTLETNLKGSRDHEKITAAIHETCYSQEVSPSAVLDMHEVKGESTEVEIEKR